MKPMNIKALYDLCKKEIVRGNGNKTIMISDDDEGNGYHYLWYAFTNAKEMLEEDEYSNLECTLDENIAPIEDTIILG